MKVSKRYRNKVLRVVLEIRYETPFEILDLKHPRLKKFDEKKLRLALSKLDDMGLITLRYADDDIFSIGTKEAGRTYFERRSDDFWLFIRRSILVPILISFITTSVIWGIKYLITGSWL